MEIANLIKKYQHKINFQDPSGLSQLNDLALKIFLEDGDFAKDREIFGNDKDTGSLLSRAVGLREFPLEKEIGWEKYKSLLIISSHKEELSRQLICHYLDKYSFGLEPFEILIIKASCQVGKLYDQLCLKWREDVVHNKLNKQAKKLLLNNKFTIIAKSKNKITQIPYSLAYKQEIASIVAIWTDLIKQLTLLKDKNADKYVRYFQSYCLALTEEDLKLVEARWLDLARCWMKEITGKVQPIHSEEYSYYDENSIRVFPDYRLSLKVEALDDVMGATQRSLEKYLTSYFGETEIFKSSFNALKTVQLYPVIDLVFCGSLDFQPAGQSLPNDDSVQKAHGTKVFLNGQVIESRWSIACQIARKVFRKDLALFSNVDCQRDGTAIMVAGHEYGEPLFTDSKVVAALGDHTESLLNEDLATLCITGIMYDRYKSGEIDRQILLNHAIDLLGSYLRYIDTARGVDYLSPYYIGMCLLGLRRMLDCGFIYQEKDEWRIDGSKLADLYFLSLGDLYRQVRIAQTRSKDLALNYLAYALETPEIENLIAKVQKND